MDITLEQVERLREKADVSYAQAKEALEYSGGNLLDALIYLEERGMIPRPEGAYYSTRGGTSPQPASAADSASQGGERKEKKEKKKKGGSMEAVSYTHLIDMAHQGWGLFQRIQQEKLFYHQKGKEIQSPDEIVPTLSLIHICGVAGGDITQGLPRVEELFEARKPKKMAQLAEISGRATIGETRKGTLISVTLTADDGDVRSYMLPAAQLLVKDGEDVAKGTQLVPGALYPQDILRIQGISALHEYLVKEVLKPYRSQGVDINDKHIEVICRHMMRRVKVCLLYTSRCV